VLVADGRVAARQRRTPLPARRLRARRVLLQADLGPARRGRLDARTLVRGTACDSQGGLAARRLRHPSGAALPEVSPARAAAGRGTPGAALAGRRHPAITSSLSVLSVAHNSLTKLGWPAGGPAGRVKAVALLTFAAELFQKRRLTSPQGQRIYHSPRSQQQRWRGKDLQVDLPGRAGRASLTDNAESDNAESECAAGPCPSRSRTRVAEPAAESAGRGPLQT
jgi:hypothetical protein